MAMDAKRKENVQERSLSQVISNFDCKNNSLHNCVLKLLVINIITHILISSEFKGFARPKDWKKDLWDLDPQDPKNNGLQNEDLIVWMRTAALPNFRKLYRKVKKVGKFKDGLPKGKYELEIEYSKYLKFLELASTCLNSLM